MLETVYRHIKHRVVRDLAWALLSTPLLQPFEDDTVLLLQQEYVDDQDTVFDWLLTIDQSPEPLMHYVQQRSQLRIGIYFEQLLGFYFSHYPRFTLLYQNLQVQGAQRTLGEFDFIVLDKLTGQYFHIESAVKFYLGNFQSELLNKNVECYNWHQWIGPNKKDSLSLKMDSMLNKQLKLATTPEAQQLLTGKGITSGDLHTRLLLRGRFFCHKETNETPRFSCSDACQYYWVRLSEFKSSKEENQRYSILPRTHWLSPIQKNDLLDTNLVQDKPKLLETIEQDINTGITTWMVVSINPSSDTVELQRFFIVAN